MTNGLLIIGLFLDIMWGVSQFDISNGISDIKVQCKEVKNTTSLLSVDSVVNKITCFGLLAGHHQVQQVLAIGD
jgi:hypothetical protein